MQGGFAEKDEQGGTTMRAWTKVLAVFALVLAFAPASEASSLRRKAAAAGPPVETAFAIETPAPGATVFGIVEVKGYVLDPRGISNIRLVVDGNVLHEADLNQPREDLRRLYPGFFGENPAAKPGFRTSFLASSLADGEHTLAIQVTFADTTAPQGQPATVLLGERTILVDNRRNQPPIGGLDSPRDPAEAGMQDYISGPFPVIGWVLDDRGVRQRAVGDLVLADIEVLVDGRVVGQALYPLPRPDIANAYPDVPGAWFSGFQLTLDSTRFTNGLHTLAVRAWDEQGASRILAQRPIFISNHYGTSRPFGAIDWPPEGGVFYAKGCASPAFSQDEYDVTYHHIDWVSGWVIDQNDNQQFEGVVAVELLLNEVSVKKTDASDSSRGPRPNLAIGAPVSDPRNRVNANVYGIYRPDVGRRYPTFTNALNSGFFFAIDTNYELFEKGRLRPGLNTIEILVHRRDPMAPHSKIASRQVYVACDTNGNVPTIGNLWEPSWHQPLRGLATLKGWAVDLNASAGNFGITRLNFYVDGVLDGSLVLGDPTLAMPSPDVRKQYPWLPSPYVDNAGFEYVLDTTKYTDGLHTIWVEAVDGLSFRGIFLQRQVVFDNPN
jgi:N-acetylmuramoyl-L-alanine amidase